MYICTSVKCRKKTASISNTKLIQSFFRPQIPAIPESGVITAACAGLNDSTWPHPRARHLILSCIQSSPTPFHSHPPRPKVCFDIFQTRKETTLTPVQRAQFVARLQGLSEWLIQRHGGQETIISSKCTRTTPASCITDLVVCDACKAIKKSRSLIAALNVEYASDENFCYIPKVLMSGDSFTATLIQHR